MASERSSIADVAIISLLLANLALTAYGLFRSPPTGAAAAAATAADTKAGLDMSASEAETLAAKFVELYNAEDEPGLYDSFDGIAKAQLTEAQLTEQLEALYPLMGTISDVAYVSSTHAGTDKGMDYYYLNYKVRLSDGAFSSGDLRLTVTSRDDDVGLVGFFVNGTTTAKAE